MNIEQIMKILPHRYPFLLVDRVLEITEDSVTAIKNVTFNEQFFQGHFPGKPIMPGVLIVEAMAQVGGLLAANKLTDNAEANMTIYFMGIDNVKFRRPVTPGDTLKMTTSLVKRKRDIWSMRGEAWVDGQLVCEGDLLAYAKLEAAE